MTTRACGFLIFRRLAESVEYLLMQASYGNYHWTPPKGHVESGESDMQTAVRETKEEAGIDREDLKILEECKIQIEYNVKGKPKTVIYWPAEFVNKDKSVTLSHEHKDFKWLPLEDAIILADYKEMQDCLRTANQYITENVL